MDKPKQQKINFNIDATRVPIFAVDSYLIGSNDHNVTLNFAQGTPDPQQQNIVARLALSREQAKEFMVNLKEHIDKYEV